MIGVLVHGDNHFVVRGPEPTEAIARALVRHWSLIRIGQQTPEQLRAWTISTREFRENLMWAVVVSGEGAVNPEVARLLEEIEARGVPIRRLKKE